MSNFERIKLETYREVFYTLKVDLIAISHLTVSDDAAEDVIVLALKV